MRDTVRRAGSLPAVVALLVLVTIAAAVSGPRVTRLPVPSAESRNTTPDLAEPPTAPPMPSMSPQTSSEPADVQGLAIGMLIVGFLVAIAAVLVVVLFLRRGGFGVRNRRLRERPESAEATSTETDGGPADPELRDAVDAGIEQLDDESDPRRAVIGCWLRLESAAQRAGVERRPDDTPSDLVTRMLTDRAISADLLARLADLYRQARYGPNVVDERMRVEARSTLARLRAELADPTTRANGSELPDTELPDTEHADEGR